MLSIYRRHLKSCPQTSVTYRRCKCPIHLQGTLNGQKVRRQSLDLSNWEKAQEKVRQWEIQGFIDPKGKEEPQTQADPTPCDELVTLDHAIQRFFANLHSRGLSLATIKKNRVVIEKQLSAFCQSQGFRYIAQLGINQLDDFVATWKESAISKVKKIERLKGFFRFCLSRKMIQEDPSVNLCKPKVNDPPTLPFTLEQIDKILDACDHFPGSDKRPGGQNAKRLKALVLLMRYSGLRIGDSLRLTDDPTPIDLGRKKIVPSHIVGNRVFVYTQKTGTNVYVPMPPIFFEALGEVEKQSARYYFWNNTCKFESRIGTIERAMKSLFKRAGIPDGHAHRFRDTFAVELLEAGTSTEDVRILLGHSSVKVTEKHYSPWIQTRQDRLEQHVMKTWSQPKTKIAILTQTGIHAENS